MQITFKVRAQEFKRALKFISAVSPRPFNQQGQAGYLFVVRPGDKGYIYARNENQVARAVFPLLDVEGEGQFVYGGNINAFDFFDDDTTIGFEVNEKGEEQYEVKYSAGKGAVCAHTAFAARHVAGCDKELEAAKDSEYSFPAAILRDALDMSNGWHALSNPQAEEQFKTVQIFNEGYETDDPKNPGQKYRPYAGGDGSLFAADRIRAFYFESDAFKGKAFTLHASFLTFVTQFLSKVSGEARIRVGKEKTYALDASGDNAIGWRNHLKQHSKYAYLKTDMDHVVVSVDRDPIIHQLRYMRAEMQDAGNTKQDSPRIRLMYNEADNPNESTLQFQILDGPSKGTTSMFVSAKRSEDTGKSRSFTINVNAEQFLSLFEKCKGNRVQLRVHLVEKSDKRPNGAALFRTIDTFVLDPSGKPIAGDIAKEVKLPEGSAGCKVTRYMPSYD